MANVRISLNGQPFEVPEGTVVAAALARAGVAATRHSISGQPRGPLCGMGICYECRVTINTQPHQLACQVVCAEGMQVETP